MERNIGSMKKIFSFVTRFRVIILNVAFVLSAILTCVLATNLSDYKIDTCLNQFFSNVNAQDTYLSVSNAGENNDDFNSLYYKFFWTTLTSNARRKVSNKLNIEELPSQKSNLYVQDYFSLTKNEYSENRHYLHDGMFFTYFDNKAAYVNSIRFECNGFILISDTFADLLLEKYGLENSGENSYLKLIENKEYAVLTYSDENGKKIKFCINNVIDSSQRVGLRASDENAIFALTYCGYVKHMSICFEADFKSDGYSSKNFVEAVYKSGFTTKNANFSLMKKNAAGHYVKDEICSEQLKNAIESKPIDPVFYTFIVVIFIACIFLVFKFNLFAKGFTKEKNASSLIALTCAILLLLQQFIKVYYLFSVLPVIFLIAWIICKVVVLFFGKEGEFINVEYNKKFFEVNI